MLGGSSPLQLDNALEMATGMIAFGGAVKRIKTASEFNDPLEYTPPPLPAQRVYEEEVLNLCEARSRARYEQV